MLTIDEAAIRKALEKGRQDCGAARVREILSKARALGGLESGEIATLMGVSDPGLTGELFETARQVKDEIYGPRLVLFAPLYISNLCRNECTYCAFRTQNSGLKRRALTQQQIAEEVRVLIDQGHKRVLLVAGEAYPQDDFSYVVEAVNTIYSVKNGKGEVRRVNVNVAPLSVAEFRQLKAANIGTYQLFQETYHRETYGRMHLAGRKRDYDWRIGAMDRAMEAGINDVGIGALFGLCDWRFEVLALMQHVRHLENRFGVGPHTLSVPRLEPADGSNLAARPPHAVSDDDFRRLVAILRLAVPYTGIIMSTRETPAIRRECFALGVSQISAGSRTSPGGYAKGRDLADNAQFCLGDHRSLDEVICDVAQMGYIPSFCTACYRLGRTGQDFMDLAKPGEIKCHCDPNALSTLAEYLADYATPGTRKAGESAIARRLLAMGSAQRRIAEGMLSDVRAGRRDVFV